MAISAEARELLEEVLRELHASNAFPRVVWTSSTRKTRVTRCFISGSSSEISPFGSRIETRTSSPSAVRAGEGQRRRVGIQFIPLGDKAKILDTSAGKAARHLAEHPADCVVALPDLYSMAQYDDTPNEHQSFADLERLLTKRFVREAHRHRVAEQAQAHFRVHCLKHDLEVLLLACPDQLRQRLGTDHALGQWRSPVEDSERGFLSGLRSKQSSRSARSASHRSWRSYSGSSRPAALPLDRPGDLALSPRQRSTPTCRSVPGLAALRADTSLCNHGHP
jgi:hypothetical protein